MRLFLQILSFFLCFTLNTNAQQKQWIDFNKNGVKDTYENPEATIENRVNNLLSQMTLAEKILMLSETAPAIDRLGIKKYYHGNEALHGVVRPGKFTVFPQAIGLAATWNPELIHQVSGTISDEARARWNELGQGENQNEKYSDLLVFWSPTVNMARDPRWGRTPETYGEDPYLTSRIGVSFVKGLQGNDPLYLKVVATPKHFAGNNEEHNRFECKAIMSERALRSYYLPAFKALITEGKAESIMTAYNAINGIPCTANKWLLTDILRNEWGFNGYIVSDCGAPGFLYTPHNYAPTREDAAAMAMKAGLDLECSGYCNECYIFHDYLPKAYQRGKVTESEINTSAFRVLRARFRLGLFDDPSLNPYTLISPSVIGSPAHQQLALETARQSIALLKNRNNILPLNIQKIKSIAVFGINAANCELGDYSGIPMNDPVSPLEGIINKVGKKVKVHTLPWTGKMAQHEIIPSGFYEYETDGVRKKGLKAEYFSNPDLAGTPILGNVENVLFDPANQAPNPSIPKAPMSFRLTGVLLPKVSGNYTLGMKKTGGFRLTLNEKLVIDNWWGELESEGVNFDLEAGKSYQIKVEYASRSGKSYCALSWKTPDKKAEDQFKAEKQMAKSNDVAIVVLGMNKSIEMEGHDRTTLELPIDQQQFIQEIYKANPKTIVVLVAGSSLAVNWIQEHVPAIVNAWYPGEQGGNAIAEVLFGDYNPAGRLPLTYYKSTDDLPAFDDYEVFNGRTYMYFDKKPLYAFGYGLSYTNFDYTNLQIDQPSIKRGDTLSVSVDIQNSGRYDGDEVVQLYVQQKVASLKLPQKQLKSFKRIHLKKGETQTVHFTLSRNDLSIWNEKNEFVLEPGEVHLQIGASSDDIRQEVSFRITY
ncbi:MAG TPA: beta-glucosidase [Prolixibacteraceae bacterium]|nr:beta-glucosidase [Prolixibacteraceae bacterium]